MFEFAFSFHGRLKRLPYFLAALGLALAYVAGLVTIAMGGAVAVAKHEWLLLIVCCLAVLPLIVAVLWCSLSLHVRRIRDMGWDPAIVISSWFFLLIADRLVLAPLVPKLVVRSAWHSTYVGLSLDLALSLALLLWPSHDPSHDDDEGEADGPQPIVAARFAAPLPAPPPPRLARVGAPVTFGRRGLK